MIKNSKYLVFIIIIIASLLYIPFLGKVHLFDWDEINFAESAREMISSENYLDVQINFEKFWEKPPLFIWLQVASMKIFGINEFAARFPNALVGIVSLVTLFLIGKEIKNTRFGLLWTAVYAGSILPFFYFKSGIIDPLFNLFIFLGIYFFYRFSRGVKISFPFLALSATFIGLGVLTKGPVAFLIFGLTAFSFMLIKKKYSKYLRLKVVSLYTIVLSLVGGFWFILQYLNGNGQILIDFIEYQIRLFSTEDAGHGGFLLYHFIVILIGVFPSSILALKGFKTVPEEPKSFLDFHHWMQLLFWVVLLLFTIVRTKIAHYSSLAYFPVTFLASYFLYYWMEGKKVFSSWLKISLVALASLWTLLLISVSIVGKNAQKIIESNLIDDPFVNGNLAASIYWSGYEFLIGVGFLVILIWSVYFIRNKKITIAGLLISTIFFTYAILIFIAPKIEGYSQRAALEFYKEKEGKAVYITTYGFKSYAHYFYAKKKQPKNTRHHNQKWLLSGNTDKEVYVVTKIHKAKNFQDDFPNFTKLYEKNGFVFFQKTD